MCGEIEIRAEMYPYRYCRIEPVLFGKNVVLPCTSGSILRIYINAIAYETIQLVAVHRLYLRVPALLESCLIVVGINMS